MVEPFTATRAAGVDALGAFVPHAGGEYTRGRNRDAGPGVSSAVSRLSPYLRHRLITEPEVVAAVIERHSAEGASKFVQEVFWRTYGKGWLELRPMVWDRYRTDVIALLDSEHTQPWRDGYRSALAGATGIECVDAWVDELATNGYLHNHTRMWFASIWIFTLELPWQLGADLFYRQLIDGDAASNTLSWRWVAGLQTKGKTYLARRENIAEYTDGRFDPHGLASTAEPIDEPPLPAPRDALEPEPAPSGKVIVLITEDDLMVGDVPLSGCEVVGTATCADPARRSPGVIGDLVREFTETAVSDASERFRESTPHAENGGAFTADDDGLDSLVAWADRLGADSIVTPYAPVGPVQERLDGLTTRRDGRTVSVLRPRRRWDTLAWPHARRGYFSFRELIPGLMREQGLGVKSTTGRPPR